MRTGGAAPASEFNINSPNHPERTGRGWECSGRSPATRGPAVRPVGRAGHVRAPRGQAGAPGPPRRARGPDTASAGVLPRRPSAEARARAREPRHGGGTRREERSQRTETGNRRKHIIIPNALAPRRALAEPYRRRSRSKEMQRRASRVCVAEIHSRAAPRHRSPMLLLHPQGDRANISALLPSPLFSRPHE